MKEKDPKAFVTNETLDEAVDTIIKGMDNLIVEQNKHLDQRFDKVEAEVIWVKDDVKGLTADLSGTPSKKEFDELRGKVDKYPAS